MSEGAKKPIQNKQTVIEKNIDGNYSQQILDYAAHPVNMGRMNDPTGSAWIKGLCGDTMEIYLVIEHDVITEAWFYTDGCGATLACGSAITTIVKNKSIEWALSLSPRAVIDHLNGLPKDHLHCAILTINTFHKAVADYLLKD